MLSRRLLRIKTIKSLYSYFTAGEESVAHAQKELHKSIDKCYELYLLMLRVIVDVADVAENRIAIAQAKMVPTHEDLNPNRRFVENSVVAVLRNSPLLNEALRKRKLSWKHHDQLIKRLCDGLQSSAYYRRYMDAATTKAGFLADRRLVVDFLSHQIEDNELLEESLEEDSLFWVDDIGYALGMAIRTIGSLTEEAPDIELPAPYKNDEDRQYVDLLFKAALAHHEDYFAYIDRFTQNWDFDRIAFMDKLIMLAAIAELVEFPTIPIKVTLDEFIELSKYYSTPGSSVFINGILDKVVLHLKEEGKIQKSGRGLIDTTLKEPAQ